MIRKDKFLKGSLNPSNLLKSLKYKYQFRLDHPNYFDPFGLRVFCGPQGSGKTISAVQYCRNIIAKYPDCIFVTNVDIKDLPPCREVIPYNGLQTLMEVSNGFEGVLYLIDEIHLEFNSLESKSISIEEMTEIAQQRKQRKCIIGTSQVYMRLAKPFREQAYRIYSCQNLFGLIQHNIEIDGTTAYEENGKLMAQVLGNYWWFHTPALYDCYDTYAKMHRYKKEWQGRQVQASVLPYHLSAPADPVIVDIGKRNIHRGRHSATTGH